MQETVEVESAKLDQICKECEGKPGRLLDLCECRGHDGRADPNIEDCDHWRVNEWKLKPISAMELAHIRNRPARMPSNRSAIGGCCSGNRSKRRPRPKKTLAERLGMLATATARHLADDNKETPAEFLEFRESQCGECPSNINRQCGICSCWLYPTVLNKGKIRWRSEACPAGKWHRQYDHSQRLINPIRNLIFHIYPLIGAEWNWHWHINQIRKVSSVFNGKIAIGIVAGHNLASADEVKSQMRDIPVTDWVIKPNSRNLAETATFTDLLNCVKTDNPNSVTFRGHTKGVTHRPSGIEQRWARLMWATCMDLPSVDDALAGHIMAGPMKCHEPLVSKQRYRWFFAGTFWWQRDKEIFERNWQEMEPTRWYPEAWPGVICKNEESASLCHDFTDGSVLSEEYWNEQVEPDFEDWKSARPNRRLDLE